MGPKESVRYRKPTCYRLPKFPRLPLVALAPVGALYSLWFPWAPLVRRMLVWHLVTTYLTNHRGSLWLPWFVCGVLCHMSDVCCKPPVSRHSSKQEGWISQPNLMANFLRGPLSNRSCQSPLLRVKPRRRQEEKKDSEKDSM
jgi:hypothetical protein